MIDEVTDLAKALSELNIDEMGPLERHFTKINIYPDLYWNDSERKDNCVWISTARYYKRTVSELEEQVGMKAPQRGATESEIYAFIKVIQRWDCDQNGKPAIVLSGKGEFSQIKNETFIVCYERTNGTRHCVLKEGERFVCYQINDTGIDVTPEVRAPGTRIFLSWIFISPRHAGTCSPVENY